MCISTSWQYLCMLLQRSKWLPKCKCDAKFETFFFLFVKERLPKIKIINNIHYQRQNFLLVCIKKKLYTTLWYRVSSTFFAPPPSFCIRAFLVFIFSVILSRWKKPNFLSSLTRNDEKWEKNLQNNLLYSLIITICSSLYYPFFILNLIPPIKTTKKW